MTIDKRALVDMANENAALMDGTLAPVLRLVAEHDLVFAVWPDRHTPDGVGTMIVKGANRLRAIVADYQTQPVTVTAVKCVNAEQAEALRRHLGLDRTH